MLILLYCYITVKVTVNIVFQVADDKQIQLQRIISRCKCQVFYAGYGEADPNEVASLPAPVSNINQFSQAIDSKNECNVIFVYLYLFSRAMKLT